MYCLLICTDSCWIALGSVNTLHLCFHSALPVVDQRDTLQRLQIVGQGPKKEEDSFCFVVFYSLRQNLIYS